MSNVINIDQLPKNIPNSFDYNDYHYYWIMRDVYRKTKYGEKSIKISKQEYLDAYTKIES